jgi:hypothetical protein
VHEKGAAQLGDLAHERREERVAPALAEVVTERARLDGVADDSRVAERCARPRSDRTPPKQDVFAERAPAGVLQSAAEAARALEPLAAHEQVRRLEQAPRGGDRDRALQRRRPALRLDPALHDVCLS